MELKVYKLYRLYYIYLKDNYLWWSEDFDSPKESFHYYNIENLIMRLNIDFDDLLKLLHNCKATFDREIINIDSYFYFKSRKTANKFKELLESYLVMNKLIE